MVALGPMTVRRKDEGWRYLLTVCTVLAVRGGSSIASLVSP